MHTTPMVGESSEGGIWWPVARLRVDVAAPPDAVERVLPQWMADTDLVFDPATRTATYVSVDEHVARQLAGQTTPESVRERMLRHLQVPLGHRFRLQETAEGTTIEEEVVLSGIWPLMATVFIVSIAGLCAFAYRLLSRDFIATLGTSDWLLIGGLLVGLYLSNLLFRELSELEFLTPTDIRTDNPHAFYSAVGMVRPITSAAGFVGLYASVLLEPALLAASMSILAGLLAVLLFGHRYLVTTNIYRVFPTPAYEYVQVTLSYSSPLLGYYLFGRLGQAVGLRADITRLFQIASLVVLIYLLVRTLQTELDFQLEQSASFHAISAGTGRPSRLASRMLVLLVAALPTYLYLWVGYNVGSDLYQLATAPMAAVDGSIFIGLRPTPLFTSTELAHLTGGVATAGLVALLVPVALLGLGLLYQLLHGIIAMAILVTLSERSELTVLGHPSVRVRIVNVPDSFATGIALPGYQAIFIARPLAESLSPKARQALLAHEVGHLAHRDALLVVTAPYLAALLLIGRNIVLAAFDFQHREYRADAYAADLVGVDAVEQLLTELKAPARLPDPSPGWMRLRRLGTDIIPTPLRTLLGLFFGQFTVTKAHPSTKQRRDAIRRRAATTA